MANFCLGNLNFLFNLVEKNRNFSEICLENRILLSGSTTPPHFKPDWRRWLRPNAQSKAYSPARNQVENETDQYLSDSDMWRTVWQCRYAADAYSMRPMLVRAWRGWGIDLEYVLASSFPNDGPSISAAFVSSVCRSVRMCVAVGGTAGTPCSSLACQRY